MALIKAEALVTQLRGLASLPLVHQIGLLVGLAASVAVGVAIVLWSQSPVYSPLFGDLSDADASQVVAALQARGIDYRLDDRTGTVLVPARQLHETRIALASAGLPKSGNMGFDLLDQKSPFGESDFMQNVRYQQALEGELAQTIASISDIEGARVHLAIPKPSVFVRDNEKPSASVLVKLMPGRSLESSQVQAIVNMVSSSVADLDRDRVTVVDQSGRLLTTHASDQAMELTANQFEYTRRIEKSYTRRIEEILTPIVGPGRVRAQVVADLDFTAVEATEEQYKPNPKAIRSEQISQQRSQGSDLAGGVPGSLSNQPPAGGSVSSDGGSGGGGSAPVSSTSSTVRNYELDRSVKHIRDPVGIVKRLSVAVLIDDSAGVDKQGHPKTKPLSADQLKNLTALVEKTVGFDKKRGDSIQIVNASFQPVDDSDLVTAPPVWQQPWFWDTIKQVGGILLVLLLVFSVLRPVMRSLAEKGSRLPAVQPRIKATMMDRGSAGADELPPDRLSVSAPSTPPFGQLAAPQDYSAQLSRAQSMVNEDPKLAANLVKEWLTE
jgi:flagellar M-ring protein FliF